MLVHQDEYGFIQPVQPLFLEQKIDSSTAVLSFTFYRDLILKYYPHEIPSKWKNLVKKIIRKYKKGKAVEFLSYNKYVLRLQSALNDSHSYTNKNMGFTFDGGFFLDLNEKGEIEVTHSGNPDVPVGAVILEKDGVAISKILDKLTKYSRGSTPFLKKYYALGTYISRSNQRSVLLKISLNGKVSQTTAIYEYSILPTYPPYEIKDQILMINVSADLTDILIEEEIPKVIQTKKVHTIQFDLRQYPRSFMHVLRLIEQFNTTNNPVHYANYYQAQPDGSHNKIEQSLEPGTIPAYAIIDRIVVLVNHQSISASEHFVLALQSLKSIGKNVATYGTATSGANGDVTEIPMLYDIKCNVNFNYVTYPDNTPIQRVGVLIDKDR